MIDWWNMPKKDFDRAKKEMRENIDMGMKDYIPKFVTEKYDIPETTQSAPARARAYTAVNAREVSSSTASYGDPYESYDYAQEKRDVRKAQAQARSYEGTKDYSRSNRGNAANAGTATPDYAQYERKNRTGQNGTRIDSSILNRQLFSTSEEALWNAANELNRISDIYNREACCNLYSIESADGGRIYFMGQSYTGAHANVIENYLTRLPFEMAHLSSLHADKGLRYEGFVHSHTYCERHYLYEDFSLGDIITALLSGNAYLSSPLGNVLRLRGRDVNPFDSKEKNSARSTIVTRGVYNDAVAKGPKYTPEDANMYARYEAVNEMIREAKYGSRK